MGRSRYPRALTAILSTTAPPTRVRTMTGPDGQTIRYHARRVLPAVDTLVTHGAYVVAAGDRVDLVAARLVGDPLQFWRLADANDQPDPLLLCATPGTRLRVPAPLGDLAHDPFGQEPVQGGSAAAMPVSDEGEDGDPRSGAAPR